MNKKTKKGHRQRLRDRFLAEDEKSQSEEAILELLLTYSIVRKDVKPLTKQLIDEFGSISNVIEASLEDICKFKGIKSTTAVLLKLVNWIRYHFPIQKIMSAKLIMDEKQQQLPLGETAPKLNRLTPKKEKMLPVRKKIIPKRGSCLFGKAVIKETINILPKIPITESMQEVTEFLNDNLPFNSIQTRKRRARYIKFRIFNDGNVDFSLLKFARAYPNSRELKDICFYRFCKVEQLLADFVQDILLKTIGKGSIERASIKTYLDSRFPGVAAVKDCTSAIVEGLIGAEIASRKGKYIRFAFREIPLASFSFVLHSEFPEPGMYDISKIENNTCIHTMLWNPDRILPSLYELRNLGIISKVSAIDNVRQFTTKWSLEEVVDALIKTKGNT